MVLYAQLKSKKKKIYQTMYKEKVSSFSLALTPSFLSPNVNSQVYIFWKIFYAHTNIYLHF